MKPYKIYSEELIDGAAVSQFFEAMKNQFVVRGALMPDAHLGYSLPIGAVVATEGVVVPSWVGYDIGCGVCAIKTTFNREHVLAAAEEIFKYIFYHVPVGFNMFNKPRKELSTDGLTKLGKEVFVDRKAARSIGTLGGGNHFIEIGVDYEKNVWIIIHSGSRGFGHGIASEYMKLACGTPKAKEGHYPLDVDSQVGKDYINDMNFALDYSLTNRETMIDAVVVAMHQAGCVGELLSDTLINRTHNHVEESNGVYIHRKGATHAEKGMLGVIPGNMRDGCMIVSGKGCEESLCSSSHGAGRVLSRTKAKAQLSIAEFGTTMRGVVANVKEGTLDESPMAYKDFMAVMDAQEDLIDIVAYVDPIVNVKG